MIRRAQLIAALFELVGMIAIVAGVGMMSIPIATIIGGIGLVCIGLALGLQAGER